MFKYGQCPPTIKVIFLFSGNAFYAAKRLDIGIAIPKEGRFANAQDSRFQASNVSNMGIYVLREGQLAIS